MRVKRSAALVAGLALLTPLAIAESPVRAAAACVVDTAPHPGGEWRTFGPTLENTRNQDAETTIGPAEALTLAPAWTFNVGDNAGAGGITGTPIIADGCTYVATDGGDVYALNADSGEVVWHVEVPSGGGINSTLAVDNGTVYGFVSRAGAPYAIALDQATGALKWQQRLDSQVGSDSYSSPVIYDGLVIAGVSGGSAELGDEADRYAFQGNFVLLDAVTGEIVKKTWVIHEPAADGIGDGYAGATVWSTPAVDAETGFAYVGTSNPFQPQKEHEYANAVIKIDLNRESPTFGEIVDSYKGLPDEYVEGMSELPCIYDIEGNPPPWYPQGVGACFDTDLDFGAAPNIFTDASGRKVVGAGQKAGVYHAFDPVTMDGYWKSTIGPGGALGGIVGTAAVTGTGIAGPQTMGGYLWSISKDSGTPQWASPTADGLHWGHQVSSANGVVYTMDLKGFLQAYDAATGVMLFNRPIVNSYEAAGGLGGGVAIARNTVYVPGNGVLVALRPGGLPVPAPTPPGGGGTPGAPEGTGPVILSTAGDAVKGYTTPVMVASRSGSLTYVNGDAAPHDVVATAPGPVNGRLFGTKLIGLGQTAVVEGLENTVAGQSYTFICTIHGAMRGTLQIVD